MMDYSIGERLFGAGFGLMGGIVIMIAWCFLASPLSLVITAPVTFILTLWGLISPDTVDDVFHILTVGFFR